LKLERFSLGVGDRFAHQAEAQLRACALAAERGVTVVPVWNKSNREHLIIGSEPASTRAAADAAVRALKWSHPYHVDADHIRLETVERFITHSDFFTIDVAESIGTRADADLVRKFIQKHSEFTKPLRVPGIERAFELTGAEFEKIAGKYLAAVTEAGRIYRHIANRKGAGNFITEVSMDETDAPQTPPELVLILAALADEGVPLQTIAPKFTGRFNKGVDYAGNLENFENEFREDLAVVAYAKARYALPADLKLSVHSGSDKFSLYASISGSLRATGAGLHLKTAGTTWLEELIGLAEAGGTGLQMAKEIYTTAFAHLDELCAPYAAVIDINAKELPSAVQVQNWSSEQFVGALRHEPTNKQYNPHVRQLLHVGYKVAAQLGPRYLEALREHRDVISRNVTENLFERHIRPLFLEN
jgi:hypothetical protein